MIASVAVFLAFPFGLSVYSGVCHAIMLFIISLGFDICVFFFGFKSLSPIPNSATGFCLQRWSAFCDIHVLPTTGDWTLFARLLWALGLCFFGDNSLIISSVPVGRRGGNIRFLTCSHLDVHPLSRMTRRSCR